MANIATTCCLMARLRVWFAKGRVGWLRINWCRRRENLRTRSRRSLPEGQMDYSRKMDAVQRMGKSPLQRQKALIDACEFLPYHTVGAQSQRGKLILDHFGANR